MHLKPAFMIITFWDVLIPEQKLDFALRVRLYAQRSTCRCEPNQLPSCFLDPTWPQYGVLTSELGCGRHSRFVLRIKLFRFVRKGWQQRPTSSAPVSSGDRRAPGVATWIVFRCSGCKHSPKPSPTLTHWLLPVSLSTAAQRSARRKGEWLYFSLLLQRQHASTRQTSCSQRRCQLFDRVNEDLFYQSEAKTSLSEIWVLNQTCSFKCEARCQLLHFSQEPSTSSLKEPKGPLDPWSETFISTCPAMTSAVMLSHEPTAVFSGVFTQILF